MTALVTEPSLATAGAVTAPPASLERDRLLADLEALWRALDGLLDSLTPADWRRRHGPDWVVADLPYHLSCFDRELVAGAVDRGANVPADEQWLMCSLAALADWNARQFARRPVDQPVEASLTQMRAARESIRRAAAELTDGDLDRPIWLPLCGWRTVRAALLTCLCHTWSHATELRLRLGQPAPVLPDALTRRALDFYVRIVAATIDRSVAADARLIAVFAFPGPGGGDWTVEIAAGACRVAEGRAARPDIVLTQRPDDFLATMVGIRTPLRAMLTGRLKVRGKRHLPAFGRLFHPPWPDQPLHCPTSC